MVKILLVEDDELLSKMYIQKLKREGFEVLSAYDGDQGLTFMKDKHPDLVLLDIMMPKLNGIQFLTKVKEAPGISAIPVIVLTNLAATQDAQKALLLGAKSYLVKSDFTPDEIVKKIKEFLPE